MRYGRQWRRLQLWGQGKGKNREWARRAVTCRWRWAARVGVRIRCGVLEEEPSSGGAREEKGGFLQDPGTLVLPTAFSGLRWAGQKPDRTPEGRWGRGHSRLALFLTSQPRTDP